MSMMPASQRTENHTSAAWVIGSIVTLWLALVLVLGARGDLARTPGAWPLPVLIAVATPLLVFLIAFQVSGAMRHFVLTLDLRLVTGIQAWRFGGLAFLALYAYGILPGRFAWPAGLGDMIIGASAPWLVVALTRVSGFAVSRWFVLWNILGILDLVVAVSMGAIVSASATGVPGEISTAPMGQLPLVVIPAFLVPLFVMLHASAVFQARRLKLLHDSGIQRSRVSGTDDTAAESAAAQSRTDRHDDHRAKPHDRAGASQNHVGEVLCEDLRAVVR